MNYRTIRHVVIFLHVVLIAGGVLFSEETLSFEKAAAIALERNHLILIARNNAAVAGNNVHIGNADLLPAVSLSTGTTYQDVSPDSGNIDTTTTTAQVQLTYTLFDGLGNVYRYRKLKVGGELGELEARASIENILVQVGEAFYAAASAYENLQIARELLSISEERMRRVEKRSDYGQARSVDVLAARVDYTADRVTAEQAKFLWDDSRRRLNVLLGREIDHEFTVDTHVVFKQTDTLDELKAAALSDNAAYLAARRRVIQSGYDVQIARSQFLPRLDFTGSYGYTRIAPQFDFGFKDAEPSLRLGATLSFNLFNGFKNRIQTRNAELQQENQDLTLARERLNLEKDVIGAYESYRTSLSVLDLEKQYVEAAELNFTRTRELYGLGQVTTTQFREAQLNLIRSRSSEAAARYEARIKEIELLRLTGRLVTTDSREIQ
jgi:adhesin transport system outer membrane protein